MPKLVFLDTETTGLDPSRHEIWDYCLIIRDGDKPSWVYEGQINPSNLAEADSMALKIGRFYDRYEPMNDLPRMTADYIAKILSGATLVGANPSFDAQFVGNFLRRHNRAPAWNHRMVCVENLAMAALKLPEPLSLVDSAKSLGIPIDRQAVHTARYDAHLAETVYDAVIGGSK